MQKCNWCGREFEDHRGTYSAGLIRTYCSARCRTAGEAQRSREIKEAGSWGKYIKRKILNRLIPLVFIGVLLLVVYLINPNK